MKKTLILLLLACIFIAVAVQAYDLEDLDSLEDEIMEDSFTLAGKDDEVKPKVEEQEQPKPKTEGGSRPKLTRTHGVRNLVTKGEEKPNTEVKPKLTRAHGVRNLETNPRVQRKPRVTKKQEEEKPKTEEKPKVSKIVNIAKEILSTEQTFNHNLAILQKLETALAKTKIAKTFVPVYKKAIAHIPAIKTVSDKILAIAKKDVKDDMTETEVGQLCKALLPQLKAFQFAQPFITEYDKSYASIRKQLENVATKKVVNDALKAEGTGHEVDSLYVNPVQRGPRYILLVADLAKALTDTTAKKECEDAHDVIKGVMGSINKRKEDSDNVDATSKAFAEIGVKTKLAGTVKQLVLPNRVLKLRVEDGKFKFDAKAKTFTPATVYVFNDAVVVVSKGKFSKKTYSLYLRNDGMVKYRVVTHQLGGQDGAYTVTLKNVPERTMDTFEFANMDKAKAFVEACGLEFEIQGPSGN